MEAAANDRKTAPPHESFRDRSRTILVHDYAGHPFQVGLSRELARRGHEVVHAYFAMDSGPKGDFRNDPGVDDVQFAPIGADISYSKKSWIRRRQGDVAYGRRVGGLIRAMQPDLVLSGNTPTEAQDHVLRACRAADARFIYWVQDVYSIAVRTLVRKRLGRLPATLIGGYYSALDRRHFRLADETVLIAERFRTVASMFGADASRLNVIENWGDLENIGPVPKNNEWAREHGLAETFNFIYSGTLALKHNPATLATLASAMRGRAKVVAICDGVGADALLELKTGRHIENLVLLPLQPYASLPQVLGAADVLVGVIEREAGVFSVPSKVQAYLCARRPILLAASAENFAAEILLREEAGLVVGPDDDQALIEAAEKMLGDSDLRSELAENGRRYAEDAYDVKRVADRFERVFDKAFRRRDGGAVGGRPARLRSRAVSPSLDQGLEWGKKA